MTTFTRLIRLRIGGPDGDAVLLRFAQAIIFLAAGFVFVAGLLKVCRLELTEAQLFGAVQQVVQTALLFFIAGALLRTKARPAQAGQ